jgi:signal transduction histidine kinase/ActR/RegA family two-component response regulator
VRGAGEKEVPIEITLSVVHVGREPYFIAVARDVSERRQAEQEREILLERERAARAEAQRLSHLKDEFVAVVSHELRTPLTVILGWTRMMRKTEALPAPARRGLDAVERNAKLLGLLVDDLLDVSRIAAGKLHIARSAVELRTLVPLAVDGLRGAAAAKGVALVERIDPRGALILGDVGRLHQVVTNLVENAIKFTPRGGVVEVELARTSERGALRVRDTGQGIDADFIPLLFDRFRQADATMARPHGGLGLGLSIVKAVVEAHGGSVSAESPGPGQGACFIVTLPLTSTGVEGVAAETDEVRLDGVRVLLVEDEPDARELVARLLEDSRAQVCAVSSASEALDALAENVVDVLVSDIGLPGMDGCEMLRRLRHGVPPCAAANVPAVALTAFAGPENRSRVLDAGYNEHLAKPFEPAKLLAAVAALAKMSAPADRVIV